MNLKSTAELIFDAVQNGLVPESAPDDPRHA
jgi:hypothetical protein